MAQLSKRDPKEAAARFDIWFNSSPDSSIYSEIMSGYVWNLWTRMQISDSPAPGECYDRSADDMPSEAVQFVNAVSFNNRDGCWEVSRCRQKRVAVGASPWS